MTSEQQSLQQLIAADDARLTAMESHDLPALAALLDEALVYTHKSGRCDRRDEYLARLQSGAVRYGASRRSETETHVAGDAGWMHGRIEMRIVRDGSARALDARFLAVWRRQDGRWRLAAYAVTGIVPG